MRNKNYYINLNDREYLDVLSSLMNKRNKLIQSGKYTDGIDEVIMKIKRPGGKFCVSVFRQNQEYHIINVHDWGLFSLSISFPGGWDGMRDGTA